MSDTVVRVAGLDIPLVFIAGLESFGMFEGDPAKISIRCGMPSPVAASTVLHEVMHAVSDAYGLRLSEGCIRTIEAGLVSVARHNPEGMRQWVDALLDDA
jgi:hypothetical protein